MLTIRKPQSSDSESINQVIKSSWYVTYVDSKTGVTKEDIDEMYNQDEKSQIESLRRRAITVNEQDLSLIAEQEEKVVGYIRCKIKEEYSELLSLYIDPEKTGQGVGTKLWNEILFLLPEGKDIILEVAIYTKAVDFYKKMGFVDTMVKVDSSEPMPISGIYIPLMKMVYKR